MRTLVDVVVVIDPGDRGAQDPVSKIVLQNIKVLASGPRIDTPENQRTPADVRAVTLQVTPDQAEKLVLAANEGKLQLVMRNYSDQDDALTRGANKGTLLTGDCFVAQPEPPSEKALEKKPAQSKPRVRRVIQPISTNVDKPAAQPSSRNSVELIEGSKRRDVDIP